MPSNSLFRDARVGCGQCRQPFPIRIPLLINVETEPQYLEQLKDLSFFYSTCPNCGYEARMPMIFVYYDPPKSNLWAVSTESYEIRFQQLTNSVEGLLSDYAKTLTQEEASRFQSLSWQFMPLATFLLKIGSPNASGKGLGYIHFSPFPKITVDWKEVRNFERSENTGVEEFQAGITEGNYPEFYESLWELMHTELQFRRQYVKTKQIEEAKKPVSTHGLSEILIYIGSNIAIPLVVGALANLISDLILEKRKTKKKLEESLEEARKENDPQYPLLEERVNKILKAQENEMLPSDKIQIRLRILEDSREFVFRGSIREVCVQLQKFRKSILRSVRLPDDCHVAIFVGDHFADGSLENDYFGKTEELGKRYKKIFNKSTRVRFADGEQGKYVMSSGEVCHQARALMEQEKYEEAILLLQDQLKGDETTIEVLYNYALSLDALGYEEHANFFYEQVLVRTINLPSLEDVAKVIVGMPLEDEA